jgi:hypothetical protein
MRFIRANGQINQSAVQAESFGHSPVGSRPRVGVDPALEARVGKGKQVAHTLANLGNAQKRTCGRQIPTHAGIVQPGLWRNAGGAVAH